MLLNSETFNRVANLTGYEKVEYFGVNHRGEVIFGAYDGSLWEKTRGALFNIREDFTVASVSDYVFFSKIGDGPTLDITLPR